MGAVLEGPGAAHTACLFRNARRPVFEVEWAGINSPLGGLHPVSVANWLTAMTRKDQPNDADPIVCGSRYSRASLGLDLSHQSAQELQICMDCGGLKHRGVNSGKGGC